MILPSLFTLPILLNCSAENSFIELSIEQCCGSGSGIRCSFTSGIRTRDEILSDLGPGSRIVFTMTTVILRLYS
jgi:hypothetical protein